MDSGTDFPARPLHRLKETPSELFARVAHLPGAVFLDSALVGGDSVSVIGFAPEAIVSGQTDGMDRIREWLLSRRQASWAGPLAGGAAIGMISYEGRAEFGLYPALLVHHHASGEWHDSGGLARLLPPRSEVIGLGQGKGLHEVAPVRVEAEMTREDYLRRVRRALDYIAAGDIYQVNLAQRFSGKWPAGLSSYGLYLALREVSPAPYAAFLKFGEREILSSSPEQFLKMSGRDVWTRPIKGTRPRFADPARDARSAAELISSDKENAELVMITDLERNDLGQVCEFGSVEVTELAGLECFQQVFHLVSTVRGRLRPEVDHIAALEACFPGGSITGAPKRRAMEIIAELEKGPRGPYTGAIGYFGVNGESQFNIAIRTAVISGARMEYQVGAGIVADSDPAAEYEETLHKGRGLRRALDEWQKRQDFFAIAGESNQVTVPHGIPAPFLRFP
ncbi:MAG: Anthranilate/para-aminobenzoate synthases component I [Verrucomicrobia bacterium]|jgi:aminodeoxychorismate synthase component I|nr:MAG: Anthranilate/para-aminobenzoate synthases component I [Verrucomicrobiota bacterium]